MKSFATATDLAQAHLSANQFVETRGLTIEGGTGAARYYVVAPTTPGANDITLANGNIAKFKLAITPITYPTANETQAGIVERATQAEVNAGIDDTRYVSPNGLKIVVTATVSKTVRIASSVGGSANTITLGMTPALDAYSAGTSFVFVPTANSSVSIPTVNIDSLGARTIVKAGGASLAVGDLAAGQPAILVDTGSAMVLSNPQNKGMSLQAFKLVAQTYDYATKKTYTFSHSLGAIPANVQLQLRCTIADAGYLAGTVVNVPVQSVIDTSGLGATYLGAAIEYTTTTVIVRFANDTIGSFAWQNGIHIPHATTGVPTAVADNSWVLEPVVIGMAPV